MQKEWPEIWDVIVVGTGMGGATIGYALAKAGKTVLFCEKGQRIPGKTLEGAFAESFFPTPDTSTSDHHNILHRSGRYTETIRDISGSKQRSFIPLTGSGPGGSSALYGMAFERFRPADFSPRTNHPEAQGTTLPESWPITYDELLPYYVAAESLYQTTTRPLDPASQELFDHLKAHGFHPYPLPLACRFAPDCTVCQGYLCAKACKNDSRSICLDPAVSLYGAELLENCEVLSVTASADTVQGVRCRVDQKDVFLKGRQIILACGAIETARLLLTSTSEDWPQGLANKSGLVGKNLMRHQIDLILVKPRRSKSFDPGSKDMGLSDFTPRFAHLQSFGRLPPAEIIVSSIHDDLSHSSFRMFKPFLKLLRPLLLDVIRHLRKTRIVLASIMEDMPYETNCVRLPAENAQNIRLDLIYNVSAYDKSRAKKFRSLLPKILRPFKIMIIKHTDNNQLIAHTCGTCRFGNDAATSVLDRNNKAHGIANLYIVDGSFFPSNGAANPSLTIAANALRVADHILGRSHRSEHL